MEIAGLYATGLLGELRQFATSVSEQQRRSRILRLYTKCML